MRRLENRTLYAREPNKKYAFVKVGEVAAWRMNLKMVEINGRLYTLSPAE